MAIFSVGSNAAWLPSLQVLLASTLALSAALLLKLSLLTVADFLTRELPSFYGLLLPWLRSPYLYILINCVIISILASSKLHHKADDQMRELAMAEYVGPQPEELVFGDPAKDPKAPEAVSEEHGVNAAVDDPRSVEAMEDDAYGGADAGTLEAEVEKAVDEAVVAVDDSYEPAVPELASPPLRNDPSDFSFLSPNEDRREKRIDHRKPSPEVGRQLRVSRPKRNDTLESTWKTITDGRAVLLERHLKKSDTWDSHARRNDGSSPPPPPKMKKSETFATRPAPAAAPANRPASPSPAAGKLRESSLGQDDLRLRAEAFIRDFKVRLQQQESLLQSQEMVNSGAR
ncbi:hypothetical protein BT93_F1249 [Corymbia citriodora subsp. variegata]|nr:hypothetical protein BT93_F1249 [Corymbia citriodora subsp. variegata]